MQGKVAGAKVGATIATDEIDVVGYREGKVKTMGYEMNGDGTKQTRSTLSVNAAVIGFEHTAEGENGETKEISNELTVGVLTVVNSENKETGETSTSQETGVGLKLALGIGIELDLSLENNIEKEEQPSLDYSQPAQLEGYNIK